MWVVLYVQIQSRVETVEGELGHVKEEKEGLVGERDKLRDEISTREAQLQQLQQNVEISFFCYSIQNIFR